MTRVLLVIGGTVAATLAEPLAQALTRQGLDVESAERSPASAAAGQDPVPPSGVPAGPPDLAVVCGDDELATHPWPVLRLAWERHAVQIGPQVHPGQTACADCVRRSVKDSGLAPGLPEDAGFLLASCEWAAVAARRLDRAAPRTMRRITSAGEVASFLVVPYADCAVCRWVPGAEPLATAYEWQMERPAAPASIPATRAMRVPAAPWADIRIRHPLPDPAPWSPDGHLDAGVLASLLTCTAGMRPGTRRWAPSAGNLGSPAVWVVTDLVDGGPLRYEDGVLVGPGLPVTPADVFAETDLPGSMRSAVIVTADPFPLMPKYGRFSYRLAALDAGCAAMQLALVAQAHGLRARFATRWTSALGERLGTRSITVVAAIERGGDAATAR